MRLTLRRIITTPNWGDSRNGHPLLFLASRAWLSAIRITRASLLGVWVMKQGMAPMKKRWRAGYEPLIHRVRSIMKVQSANKGWAATGMPITWVRILCVLCTRVSMTLFHTLSKVMTHGHSSCASTPTPWVIVAVT